VFLSQAAALSTLPKRRNIEVEVITVSGDHECVEAIMKLPRVFMG
jgi:hypothetical protein